MRQFSHFLRVLILVTFLTLPTVVRANDDLLSTAGLRLIAGGSGGGGGDVGQYASLAFDPEGGLHIAYYDATFRRLKYARRLPTASNWQIQTVTSGSPRGEYASLAVGPKQEIITTATLVADSRTVTIVEGLTVSPLLVGAQVTTGTLLNHVVESVDERGGTLELQPPYTGPSGTFTVRVAFHQPTISFQGGVMPRQLYVARPDGRGGWFVEVVDGANVGTGSTFTGFDTSIAVGTTGDIHIAYRDGRTSGGMTNQLRYAHFDGEQWHYETPNNGASDGFGNKLILDKRGNPIIIHMNYLQDGLLASVRDDASTIPWHVNVLDPSPLAGRSVAVTYSPGNDLFRAVYSERITSPTQTNRLKMVTTNYRAQRGWELDKVDTLSDSEGIGLFAAISESEYGFLHLAYYDNQTRDLLGISGTPAEIVRIQKFLPLDERGDVGRYVSADFSPLEYIPTPLTFFAYSAYYDATRQALKVARIPVRSSATGTPTIEYVDGVKYGTDSAIGRTSTHNVIAYHHATEGTLRLARWPIGTDPEVTSQDIVIDDSSENVGGSVAMAIGADDTIYLAYYDRANGALRAALVTDALTTHSEIAGASNGFVVGPHVALAFDGGRMAIAFHVESFTVGETIQQRDTLYLAEIPSLPAAASADWTQGFTLRPVLPGQIGVGRFCSAVYDEAGNLHLAFYVDSKLAPGYVRVDSGGGVSGLEIIEDSLFITSGQETSIAIQPQTGIPAVAYYDVSMAGLKYAEKTDEGWTVEVVDPAGDTGHGPVLLFDNRRGVAHIVYHDQAVGRLRVATRKVGSLSGWRPMTLLEDTHGYNPSAILNEDSTLSLSFHQTSTGNLWTATTIVIDPLNSANREWLNVR